MEFEAVWTNIVNCAGQEFYTITGLPFTYQVVNGAVLTNRTDYPLSRSNFERAAQIGNLQGPGQISGLVMGPSYVYAILSDGRIQ